MKTIQNQNQREELKNVLEKIINDLENLRLYAGKLSIERVLPLPETPTNTPAGFPHLIIQGQKQQKLLGLIPYNTKEIILIVKEGFYYVEDKGRKDMFVRVLSKSAEAVIKKHLLAYGNKNQVTEIIYNK
ncbi:MAG: hypothetical protein NTW93_01845 [Phycisphaerae bacterium]|nr:hypothetical protein [Phycisphaerae bacterium]